uniref:sn-1-specific diacylglycerol lipase n=2 Tax=Timema TaxID=61471 RepID=A0A7R9PAP8_TIMCA|nr:unnamed protein product [Timema californicum]
MYLVERGTCRRSDFSAGSGWLLLMTLSFLASSKSLSGLSASCNVLIAEPRSWEMHLSLHVWSFRGGGGFGVDSWPISAFGLASVFDLIWNESVRRGHWPTPSSLEVCVATLAPVCRPDKTRIDIVVIAPGNGVCPWRQIGGQTVRRMLVLVSLVCAHFYGYTWDCTKGGDLVRIYLAGVVALLGTIIGVLVPLVNRSAQGSIMDTNQRKCVPALVAVKIFLILPEIAWNVLGTLWMFGDVVECGSENFTVIVVEGLVLFNWVLLGLSIFGLAMVFDPLGSVQLNEEEAHHRKVTGLWMWRFQWAFCWVRKDKLYKEAFQHVAGKNSHLFLNQFIMSSNVLDSPPLLGSESVVGRPVRWGSVSPPVPSRFPFLGYQKVQIWVLQSEVMLAGCPSGVFSNVCLNSSQSQVAVVCLSLLISKLVSVLTSHNVGLWSESSSGSSVMSSAVTPMLVKSSSVSSVMSSAVTPVLVKSSSVSSVMSSAVTPISLASVSISFELHIKTRGMYFVTVMFVLVIVGREVFSHSLWQYHEFFSFIGRLCESSEGFGMSGALSRVDEVVPKPLDKRISETGMPVVGRLFQLSKVVLDGRHLQTSVQSHIADILGYVPNDPQTHGLYETTPFHPTLGGFVAGTRIKFLVICHRDLSCTHRLSILSSQTLFRYSRTNSQTAWTLRLQLALSTGFLEIFQAFPSQFFSQRLQHKSLSNLSGGNEVEDIRETKGIVRINSANENLIAERKWVSPSSITSTRCFARKLSSSAFFPATPLAFQSATVSSFSTGLFSALFRSTDLSPSDFIAGFILLRVKQKRDVREYRRQQLLAERPDNTLIIQDVMSEAPPWMTLELARHYLTYAMAAYSWPFVMYRWPFSGLCRLSSKMLCCACIRLATDKAVGYTLDQILARRSRVDCPTCAENKITGTWIRFRQGGVRSTVQPALKITGTWIKFWQGGVRRKPHTVQDDNCCLCNLAGFRHISGLDMEDVLYASFENAVFQVGIETSTAPFFVSLDHVTQSVVVTIRGSISLRDLFTDFTAGADRFDVEGLPPDTMTLRTDLEHSGGCRKIYKCYDLALDGIQLTDKKYMAHKGMIIGANNIKACLDEQKILEKAFTMHPGYNLVISGHSLGAGIGTLLALLLRPQYPDVLLQGTASEHGIGTLLALLLRPQYPDVRVYSVSPPVVALPTDRRLLDKQMFLFGCESPASAGESQIQTRLFTMAAGLKERDKRLSKVETEAVTGFGKSSLPPMKMGTAVLTRDAARLTESFCFSVGLGDDFVMRLSVDSTENLRTNILEALHRCRLPKYRLMLNGFGYTLFGVPTGDLETTWKPEEASPSTLLRHSPLLEAAPVKTVSTR